MFDRIEITASDVARLRKFCEAALTSPGASIRMKITEEATGGNVTRVDLGTDAQPRFWIGGGDAAAARAHAAFATISPEVGDAFHAAGIAADGTDSGAPGMRPQFRPGYYAACLLDPGGNNIEAVFRDVADGGLI